ncbi:MAG: sarcosine oxidase subunit gamma [Pseudomonadota bacterium]
MAEITLTPTPPLGGLSIEIGANRIVGRSDLALISVAIPTGAESTCAERLKVTYGLDLPEPTVSRHTGAWRIVSMTADQLMLIGLGDGMERLREVGATVGNAGYTTNQTDAWVCVEVSGPDTLSALERICPLDLAELSFPVDGTARTSMEHLGTLIIRLGRERFLLCSASSSAGSFAHAIETSYRNVVSRQSARAQSGSRRTAGTAPAPSRKRG